jgi:hypothetical protein
MSFEPRDYLRHILTEAVVEKIPELRHRVAAILEA